ncbi:glycosyltransferase family 4 protein [Isoptericola sp. 4D.3]|uniref:Glycosyltransferase family 4 protein n=1 Tax=Isoptericola peretonis TaxID=2918523 RepID=A0ABT0J5E2_9MICO|nr:glycosyltransferase family 4 protein [Isoptericola sp. 4D.3]
MPATYVAARGGLFDHIKETALATRAYGIHVTVTGKAGAFLDGLQAAGVDTLPSVLEHPDEAIAELGAKGPWDLIHTHPFAARAFAVQAAKAWQVPLVATIHGWYLDDVQAWHQDASVIIGVTDAITDRLKAVPGVDPAAVRTIENHRKLTPDVARRANPSGRRTLLVVSRIDRDFAPVAQLLDEFVTAANDRGDRRWDVAIAGTGTGVRDLVATIARRWSHPGAPPISLLGWLDAAGLAVQYARAAAVIAPGRAAVDAMISGIPTVMTRQIGSYAMAPFGDARSALYGRPGERVMGEDFFGACTRALDNPEIADEYSYAHRRIAELTFDPDSLTRRLVAAYEVAALERFRQAPDTRPSSRSKNGG